MIILSLL